MSTAADLRLYHSVTWHVHSVKHADLQDALQRSRCEVVAVLPNQARRAPGDAAYLIVQRSTGKPGLSPAADPDQLDEWYWSG